MFQHISFRWSTSIPPPNPPITDHPSERGQFVASGHGRGDARLTLRAAAQSTLVGSSSALFTFESWGAAAVACSHPVHSLCDGPREASRPCPPKDDGGCPSEVPGHVVPCHPCQLGNMRGVGWARHVREPARAAMLTEAPQNTGNSAQSKEQPGSLNLCVTRRV